VAPENLVVTRGADEALVLLSKAFCEPHQDSIVISKPAFGVYAVNATASPVKIHDIPLLKNEDGFALDKEGIIHAACDPDKNVKLVFLCSPNNPTAGSFPKEDMLDIIKAVEGHAVVVLDEAYAEFSRQGSMVGALASHPNLIILRTLSKAYALAGIRIGAMLSADKDFIALVKEKVIDVYPLPRPSVEAALTALDQANKTQVQDNIQKMIAERDKLAEGLEKISFVKKVYPSDANFLLVEVDEPKAVVAFAAQHGFILRDFSSKPETAGCIRISPALPEQNAKLLEVLGSYSESAAA
jgi:histidinol-phosphate aminotransferase